MGESHSFVGISASELDQVFRAVDKRWEQLRNQRLLLTGGTGFIGKWLLATFLYANRKLDLSAHIVVLSRNPGAFLELFPELRKCKDITFVQGDVRHLESESVGRCQFAIHAATDVVASSTPREILDTCIRGTSRVLDAMADSSDSRRRVLLLSSGAVYGRALPGMSVIPEDWVGAPDPLTPASAYGEGKRVSEMLCAMAAASEPGLEVSIARCFAFVGPHLPLDKHFAIGNFIRAAMRGEDIIVQGDGTPLRSYLYASDLAFWLWVMMFDAPSGRAFNVGGSDAISIGELAYRVNKVLGGKGKVQITQKPRQGAIPQAYVPSVDRIATELGLVPKVSLDDAIMRTAHWASHYL